MKKEYEINKFNLEYKLGILKDIFKILIWVLLGLILYVFKLKTLLYIFLSFTVIITLIVVIFGYLLKRKSRWM